MFIYLSFSVRLRNIIKEKSSFYDNFVVIAWLCLPIYIVF